MSYTFTCNFNEFVVSSKVVDHLHLNSSVFFLTLLTNFVSQHEQSTCEKCQHSRPRETISNVGNSCVLQSINTLVRPRLDTCRCNSNFRQQFRWPFLNDFYVKQANQTDPITRLLASLVKSKLISSIEFKRTFFFSVGLEFMFFAILSRDVCIW